LNRIHQRYCPSEDEYPFHFSLNYTTKRRCSNFNTPAMILILLPAFAMLIKPGAVCFISKFSSGKFVP